MALNLEELDTETRRHMLAEFELEEASGNPYRSKTLSEQGVTDFPHHMRQAIVSGNDSSLIAALTNGQYWVSHEFYTTKTGLAASRRVNHYQAAERLGITEYNTWYVRGLAKRLIEEGVTHCQIYRAALPKWEPSECSLHEGRIVEVLEIYHGHRANYHPVPGRVRVLSIPFAPGCHHTIKRVRS